LNSSAPSIIIFSIYGLIIINSQKGKIKLKLLMIKLLAMKNFEKLYPRFLHFLQKKLHSHVDNGHKCVKHECKYIIIFLHPPCFKWNSICHPLQLSVSKLCYNVLYIWNSIKRPWKKLERRESEGSQHNGMKSSTK
jgi:hypothetical protein